MDAYPSVGSYIAGRYRIDALLGEGGMGAVFRATDANGNVHALKFPASDIRQRPGMMSRFANEAVAASKIASEHAVRIHGVEATEQGVPFIVMELLEGTDLDIIIDQQAPVDIPRAVHFALQILRALQVAHGAGVVHRDLKPSNCFVVRTPEDPELVKLIDFGITKILGDEGANLTRTSVTMGTPAYMSPEQARSAKAAEPRSDLYSVGVILYELLTKKRPFEAGAQAELSHNEMVVKICTEPPMPIRQLRPDLPTGLAAAVEHALVKVAGGRFPDAAAFARALEPYADARSAAVLARIGAGAPSPGPGAPMRGATAEMAFAPTPFVGPPPGFGQPPEHAANAATQPPPPDAGRAPQRTVVAEGPIMFQEAAPATAGVGGTGTPIAPLPVIAPGSPPPVASNTYEPPPRRKSGGGRGGLLVVLGVLALGLIGTGVYFGAVHSSSEPPPAASATTKPTATEDEGEEDDEGTGKKKKKKKADDDPAAPTTDETTDPAKPTPAPAATVKPKTDAGTTPKADAGTAPKVDAGAPPTTTGTTTAPTLVLPPGWQLPSGTAPPATTTAPPATTTAPPATTTAPPATTTAPPATTIPPIMTVIPPKPKIGGK